jgi:hypothetical protein
MSSAVNYKLINAAINQPTKGFKGINPRDYNATYSETLCTTTGF